MADWRTKHGMCRTPEYRAWYNAKARCENPRHEKYPLYGGRGIAMCEEWRKSFSLFFAEVGPKPTPRHSLDRIETNLGYEPGNCRWATPEEQNANRRNCRDWVLFGRHYPTAKAAADYLGVTVQTINNWCLGCSQRGFRRRPRGGCYAVPLYPPQGANQRPLI